MGTLKKLKLREGKWSEDTQMLVAKAGCALVCLALSFLPHCSPPGLIFTLVDHDTATR